MAVKFNQQIRCLITLVGVVSGLDGKLPMGMHDPKHSKQMLYRGPYIDDWSGCCLKPIEEFVSESAPLLKN